MRALAAIHLLGNALLLWLGYYWLGTGETRASTLLWSALIAVLLLTLTCTLHAATLSYFGSAGFRLRKLPKILIAAIALLIAYALLAQWQIYSAQPAFKLASYLTLTFRKPVKPSTILAIFNAGLWLVRWMVIPVLSAPILYRLATGQRRRRKPIYWIVVPMLLVCAIWLPSKLLGWVPQAHGFSLEMFSFVIRALVAYLLFVSAFLALEFVTSTGKPRWIQPSTVASP